jgi:predicted RND superfamily exporter protein
MVIVGTVIIVALSIFGITRIELNNYLIEGLTTRDQLRQDFNYFENNFSGVRPFEMAITPADTAASLFDVPQLRAMDQLENYLTTQFGVGFVTSPVAVVKAANKAYNNGNPVYYKLPDTDEELIELTEALEPFRKRKEMKLIVTRDGKIGRFTGKMNDIGSQAFRAREEKFNQFISSTPVMKNINVHMTGGAVMLDKNNQYLVDNTLQGLLVSVLVVALIIAVIHRNWRMIIIAIIPNMLPIVLIGGLMGFAGIELKSSTSIIFSIAFGIATDDTIHFLARLKLELAQGKSVFYAVKRTFLSTGKAVIVTSLILIAGFLTLIASGFESTFYFGLLVSITLLVAVLTDLLLFPVLVIWLLGKDRSNKIA